MDLTNDIPDFVRETFVQFGETPYVANQPVPLQPDSFESKWSELGAILKQTWSRNEVFSFSQIRLCDIVDALPQPIPDDRHLWACTCLAPFIRLTSWEHIRTETGFYELAATLATPTLIFAFESPHDIPRTYMYGPHELLAIPRVVTAATFVFLLQRVTHMNPALQPQYAHKKKRPVSDVSPTATTDPAENDFVATMTVQSTDISEPPATIIPVTERQRMGPPVPTTTSSSSGGISTGQTGSTTVPQLSFDLHEIVARWKAENKRPTVEKICETEHITQRDVKRWLDQKGLTWTKMLIQYGFRETK